MSPATRYARFLIVFALRCPAGTAWAQGIAADAGVLHRGVGDAQGVSRAEAA